MKIKEITIKNFKRFTSLKILNIPVTAKLVILIGSNGCGKTSLLEALNHWYKFKGYNSSGNQDYSIKKENLEIVIPNNWYIDVIKIDFHDIQPNTNQEVKGKFYFRTAYRNEPDFSITGLNKQDDPTKRIRLDTLMGNDTTVSENYQRLVSQTLSGVFKEEYSKKTVEFLRDEIIGKIQISLSHIFDDLNLSSIGDPLSNGSFFFEKGISKDFHYKNLSAGEKSVFDLILDLIVKSTYYSNAIFCIDEPEAHMHTKLQSLLLQELYSLVPDQSQLWLTTHSIGMLKTARDIEALNPGSVVFLNFDDRDFDTDQILEPTRIDKAIWGRFFNLALDDYAKLVSPSRIVFCEGNTQGRRNRNFDAQVYTRIFENKYPDTAFISTGSSNDLEDSENQSLQLVSNLLKHSIQIKLVDRDDRSPSEVQELSSRGIKVLSKRHIENYLLSDELISKLCNDQGKSDKIEECLEAKRSAITESVTRQNAPDDVKSASGDIYVRIKRILALTRCGNDTISFLRDTIAPLVTEDLDVYRELENEIFH